MIFSKEENEKIKKLRDSVHKSFKIKDSDALAKLAYEFAQMGNYFDRANSAHSREILGKEDDSKYKELLRKGIQVKAQLQKEVAAMNAAQIDPSKKPKGLFAKEDDTNRLLRDGIHLLYWAADKMRDQTGIKLSKELDKLFDDYSKNKMFGTKDSKVKDYSPLAQLMDEMSELSWEIFYARQNYVVLQRQFNDLRTKIIGKKDPEEMTVLKSAVQKKQEYDRKAGF